MHDSRDIVALARGARTSTTYKPALLKAIALIGMRNRPTSITLRAIGAEFARLYWNQTVVFRLRQGFGKEPEVLQEILAAAERYSVRKIADLPENARVALEKRMAAILPTNVLKAFHSSAPAGMPPLFTWSRGDDSIVLTDSSADFVQHNALTLIMIAEHWWAGILEKINILSPAIIEKVERDGAARSNLSAFLKILRSVDELECFYCGRVGTAFHVDHVLPWTFILADPLWDLVLACAPCNLSKSDRLPAAWFIEKLQQINGYRVIRSINAYAGPPPIHAGAEHELFNSAIAVRWPANWKPG
jgi:hypothetical protein